MGGTGTERDVRSPRGPSGRQLHLGFCTVVRAGDTTWESSVHMPFESLTLAEVTKEKRTKA